MANSRQLKAKVDDNTLKAWLNEMNEVDPEKTNITVMLYYLMDFLYFFIIV